MAEALMSKVSDVAELRQRMKATEARLCAAAQEETNRNARLLDLLKVVEKELTHKHAQISRLEEENSHALEKVHQLTDLMHDTLTMVESVEQRRPQLPVADLEQLIQRIPSKMKHDVEESVEAAQSSNSHLELTQPVEHDS